ncbi:MAG: hypothetical protein JWO38_2114 [Gemmataceae bacterium]|nr:hypothetical protein [Gemmataceae bacterium]
MPPYPVLCYAPGCPGPAAFKVAARWSDGLTHELKTYSLACPDCLGPLFAGARAKRAACRLAPGETLDEAGIYELNRGGRDKTLKRRPDLEERVKLTVESQDGRTQVL